MNGEIPKLLSFYMAGQWLNLSGLLQHRPLRVRGSPAGAIKLEIKLAKAELEDSLSDSLHLHVPLCCHSCFTDVTPL